MPQDALSQEDIDRLLHEMASGNTDALADAEPEPPQIVQRSTKTLRPGSTSSKVRETANRRIRDYDFRRPNRISKEYMRGLRLIHESFAREAPRVVGPMLRAGGQMKIISMEQTIYEEFRNHLSPHCFVCTVTMPPLEGEIAFHVDLEPAFMIIDRMLGGIGSGIKQARELTMLELNMLQRVIAGLLPIWRDAWLPIIHLEPAIARTLSSVEFLQLTAANESVLVTTFQARFLSTDLEVTACIPYVMIAPILTRVAVSEHLHGARGNDEADRQRLIQRMRDVPLSITARLGAAPVPISELSQLTIGDVIRLDVPVEGGTALLHISEHPYFVARPGLVDGSLAVQVTDVLRRRE